MAAGVTYLVFLLPVASSLVFGGAVLGQVLQEPGRELNMWQFDTSGTTASRGGPIQILGLESRYATSEPIAIQVSVTDDTFDCGNLYITIYRVPTGEAITQSGFFDQCFVGRGSALPVGDRFSEIIGEQGDYEIRAEMSSRSQMDSISAKGKFSVR